MSYDAGDWRIPFLDISVYSDGTTGPLTVATLEIEAPDGTATPVVATPGGNRGRWEAPGYELTAGEWIERWTVSGVGAGRQRSVISVAPDPGVVPAGARVYATTGDYAGFLRKAPPTGSRRTLWVASQRVDELLTCALYETDAGGYPLDVEQRKAVTLATCAQADYQQAIGDPFGRGALGTVTSMSIGSVSVGRAVTKSGSTSPPRYHEDAVGFLARANLLNHGPITGW